MRNGSRFGVCAVLAAGIAMSAYAQPREPEPGEGVICALAIYSVLAEVGKKCFPGQDSEVQLAVEEINARIDEYVLANSTPAVTQEDLNRFKRDQGHTDDTSDQLCANRDAVEMYRSVVERGVVPLRSEIDRLLARPGQPSWGTCL